MKGVSPFDLLKKENYTEEEVWDARYEICKACTHFNALKQCDLCHCFMIAKVRLKEAYCPLMKW